MTSSQERAVRLIFERWPVKRSQLSFGSRCCSPLSAAQMVVLAAKSWMRRRQIWTRRHPACACPQPPRAPRAGTLHVRTRAIRPKQTAAHPSLSFRCPTRTLARLADGKGASVWLYSFEQGPALHAYEIDYVFGGAWVSRAAGNPPPSAALIAVMQRYWTRFALAGDPNGAGDPLWPRFQTASDQHMVLVAPPHQGMGLASAECDFWRSYWRNGGTVDLR